MPQDFGAIESLIKQSQLTATRAVNTVLVNLYWQVGEYICRQVASSEWGDKTIDELAEFIGKQHPELKGSNRRGLYRMKQFFETYSSSSIVSTQLTQFSLSDIRHTDRSYMNYLKIIAEPNNGTKTLLTPHHQLPFFAKEFYVY